MIAPLVFALIVTGFSGIVAQTVLIRESLIIYGGNELSIGLTIGSWILWEALGACIGGRWPRRVSRVPQAFIAANLVFSLAFPAGVYCIRTLKVILGLPPEVSMGIAGIFFASMAIFLPVGLLHGLSFTASCRVYESLKQARGQAAGRVYFYEMLGTIAGGILVSYVLITWLHSFRIAALILILIPLACLVMAVSAAPAHRRLLAGLSLAAALGWTLFLALGLDDRLQSRSITVQWHGREVVSYENSHYQNIAVTRAMDQYTFFTDGLPAATMPVPDITRVEEIVHIPLLAHGAPRDILIIHGGAGGVIGEVLKYPTVRRVDYVEIDPAYLSAITRHPSGLVRSELGDCRVELHYTDGRGFVKRAHPTRRYDVVLLGLSAPGTLQANRFFTVEFFREARRILADEGILVFTVPGSLTYYGSELRDINMSAMATARSVFDRVAVVPGEENIFLVSPSAKTINLSAQQLEGRLRGYGITTRLISLPHLIYRLDAEKMEWFLSAIGPSRAEANHDLTPKGLYYNIAFANALHSPSMKGLFATAERRGVPALLVVLAVFAAGAFLLKGRYPTMPVLFVISTTGFVVMLLELSLIFVFQVLYGYVFHEIGMLITMLMAGMAAGSMAVARRATADAKVSRTLMAAEAALTLLCLLLLLIFTIVGQAEMGGGLLGRPLFFALLFISGLLAGMEFPLAAALHDEERPLKGSVGPVYASDLIGGFIGGITGGFFLFPLMGLVNSCLLLAAVKVCGLLLLLSGKRK